MLKKLKHFILFFAATLNIAASAFFIYSDYYRFSKESDSLVSATLGVWFAVVSGLLWLMFIVLYLASQSRKK